MRWSVSTKPIVISHNGAQSSLHRMNGVAEHGKGLNSQQTRISSELAQLRGHPLPPKDLSQRQFGRLVNVIVGAIDHGYGLMTAQSPS